MTIPSTQRKAGPFSGNGVQTSWPFTFKVFSASDVAVVAYTPLTGEVTLDPSEYTVTINANQDTSPGGTVEYPAVGALGASDRLTVLGGLPYDQPLDLPAGGNFSPAALENQLDRTIMQVQQLAEQQSRAVVLPTTSDVSPAFPFPEASKFIAWNDDGTALRNADGSDLSVEIAFSDWTFDTFTGDGTTVAFSLQKPPGNIANMALTVDGLALVPGTDFTLLANVITFATAPADGAEILVRYGRNAEQFPADVIAAVQGPFLQLDNRVTYDFTVTAGKNALAISPTIAAGVTVTVPTGSKFITLDEYTGGGGPGETLGANVGAGVPVFDSKDVNTLNFRSLVAGSGIGITSVAGGATTISSTVVPGETNDGANVGGGTPIYDGKTGSTLNFRSLAAGTGISLSSTPGGATTISTTLGAGEANTASNVGTGTGVLFKEKSGVDLRFKTIKAGSNITITNGADDVTIAASGAAAGVSSFNARTGAVTLTSADVVSALQTGANAGAVAVTTTPPNGTSNSFLINRTASYSGGTPGWVNSALFLDTTVSPGVTSFEWGITSRINNSATAGENVGGYFQGNKLAAGPTWGSVAEVCDLTNANTTASSGGAVGLEVDVWCNGSDAYERRIGIDVVVGNAQLIRNGVAGIGKGYAYDGIRITAMGGDNSVGAFNYGVNILSADAAGIVNQASGVRGIQHLGSYTVGIDLSGSTNSDSAIRIKANEWIALEGGSSVKMRYNSSNGYIEFYGGGARRGYINAVSGADNDLASGTGTPANMVTTDTTQTITGAKTFSTAITASAGISCNNGIILNGSGATLQWPSTGNVTSTATGGSASLPASAQGFLRVLIDGTVYKIPFYNN